MGTSGTLLLVDDDATFCQLLGGALARRGFAVTTALTVQAATELMQHQPPEYAVFDLRIGNDSGLTLVERLHRLRPDARIVVLTGLGSIQAAVDAILLGASQFITKPSNADEVMNALHYAPETTARISPPAPYYSPKHEGEYLQRMLDENDGNISKTARFLGLHRRTLQRKLARLLPNQSD